MSAVVVRDQMDIECGRDAAVEVIKKGEKFLVTMARFAHGNHFAIEHVERGEQSGGLFSTTSLINSATFSSS
jgi:hypothetical protein